MQESSYLGKIALVIIWFRMTLTQTYVYKFYFVHFDILTKYQCLVGCYNFLPMVGSLIPFWMLLIDIMHSPTQNQHWVEPIGVKNRVMIR
jgi:hypothetical protein